MTGVRKQVKQQGRARVCTGHNDPLSAEGVMCAPEDLSRIALSQFGSLLNEFLSSDPDTFKLPPYRTCYPGDREQVLHNLPRFKKEIDRLLGQATEDTAFFLVQVRRPEYHQDFQTKGFQESFPAFAVPILPRWHNTRQNYTLHQLIFMALDRIRGAFKYGEFGVYIIRIPLAEIHRYFVFHTSPPYCSIRPDVWISPDYIVDFHGEPSQASQQLLESVLLKYWHRLKAEGYVDVRTRSGFEFFTDKIPCIVRKGDKQIGLDDNWNARGVLEAMHRIFILNKMIEIYKEEYDP